MESAIRGGCFIVRNKCSNNDVVSTLDSIFSMYGSDDFLGYFVASSDFFLAEN